MEITENFIKFVGEVIVLLVIFSVLFGSSGIASNTYNYLSYAEPLMLQNYISAALTAGGQAVGDFSLEIQTTGQPHLIKIYEDANTGIEYIQVIPATRTYLKTDFSDIKPEAIATDCYVYQEDIQLDNKITQTIRVRKTVENGRCILRVSV